MKCSLLFALVLLFNGEFLSAAMDNEGEKELHSRDEALEQIEEIFSKIHSALDLMNSEEDLNSVNRDDYDPGSLNDPVVQYLFALGDLQELTEEIRGFLIRTDQFQQEKYDYLVQNLVHFIQSQSNTAIKLGLFDFEGLECELLRQLNNGNQTMRVDPDFAERDDQLGMRNRKKSKMLVGAVFAFAFACGLFAGKRRSQSYS